MIKFIHQPKCHTSELQLAPYVSTFLSNLSRFGAGLGRWSEDVEIKLNNISSHQPDAAWTNIWFSRPQSVVWN
jgi:hypothetical protein